MLCKTAHATAYAALGHRYTNRLNSPRQPAWKTGQALGITRPLRIGDHEIGPRALSHTVLRTVTRYCYSADSTLAHHHVPRLRGLDAADDHAQLADQVLPFAAQGLGRPARPEQGVVRFEHDHYLKMWALTGPRLEADFLFLDEAQDTNPVLEQVFTAQRDHAQLVMVGDSAQAIYGWRGARDVMTGFDAEPADPDPLVPLRPTDRRRGQPVARARRRPHPPDRNRPAIPPRSAASTSRTQCCVAPTSAP